MAKMIPTQYDLSEDELKVLKALAEFGAMQPSQLAAETLLLPADLNGVLKNLSDVRMRLIIVRPDETPDGQVVILTKEGKEALYQNMSNFTLMRKGDTPRQSRRDS